jgi:hypothetical protein
LNKKGENIPKLGAYEMQPSGYKPIDLRARVAEKMGNMPDYTPPPAKVNLNVGDNDAKSKANT